MYFWALPLHAHVTWKARAAQGRDVDFKSNERAVKRERYLSIRKCLNDWGIAFLDADHWDLRIEAYRTTCMVFLSCQNGSKSRNNEI